MLRAIADMISAINDSLEGLKETVDEQSEFEDDAMRRNLLDARSAALNDATNELHAALVAVENAYQYLDEVPS